MLEWQTLVAGAALATLAALAFLYRFSTSTFGYWRARGVPCLLAPPKPLFGHLFPVATGAEMQMSVYQNAYRQHADDRYVGLYQMRTPFLMVRDLELIRHVLIKDFAHFTDHGLYTSSPRRNPVGNGLFNMRGAQWKIMRAKLTPAFVSSKLRHMHRQIADCTSRLMRCVACALSDGSRGGVGTMEVRDVLGDYSTDVIGTCAFGLQLNAIDDRDSAFRKYGKAVFLPSLHFLVRELSWMISPTLRKALPMNDFPQEAIDFFTRVFADSMDERAQNHEVRQDLMQSLIQARNDLVVNNKESVKFEETDIVANAFVLFAAGFETVSTAMSFCLYELALNKSIQDRVREEMTATKAKHGGETNSEFLADLNYLEMVLAETLRKYPALMTLFREATIDYHVPDDNLVIEKGTKVIIPVHAIHYDEQFYPDPDRFDPERFTAEEKAKRPSCTYLPFGDGPRICIGKRFAEMEMKLALTELLTKYEVEPCEKTDIPMKYSKRSIIIIPENGIWLKFRPIAQPSAE